jgi:hypothetical protein
MGIPDVQRAHLGMPMHLFSIGPSHVVDRVFTASLAKTNLSQAQHDARGKSLHIPFPGCWECLIKIINVKQETALWARKPTKICRMAVSAGLYYDSIC